MNEAETQALVKMAEAVVKRLEAEPGLEVQRMQNTKDMLAAGLSSQERNVAQTTTMDVLGKWKWPLCLLGVATIAGAVALVCLDKLTAAQLGAGLSVLVGFAGAWSLGRGKGKS